MKLLLCFLSVLMAAACVDVPHPVCLPPPATVVFENYGRCDRVLTYGTGRYVLPASGRLEVLRESTTYRVGVFAASLPEGPVDQFGALHVAVP